MHIEALYMKPRKQQNADVEICRQLEHHNDRLLITEIYQVETGLTYDTEVPFFISNRFRPGSRKSFFFSTQSKNLRSFSCPVLPGQARFLPG